MESAPFGNNDRGDSPVSNASDNEYAFYKEAEKKRKRENRENFAGRSFK